MQLGRLSFALFVASLALFGCASRQPVATVGGRVINRATYQQTLERYYGRSAVRWLIQRELLLRANEEQKLVSDKDVEREYKNALRQMGFQDERQFLAYLARQGLDKDAFWEDLRFNLILFRLREKALKPTEKQLREFYERNKLAFAQPPMVQAYIFQAPNEQPLLREKQLIQKGENIAQRAYEFYKDNPTMRSQRGLVTIPLVNDPHFPPSLLKLLAQAPPGQLVGPQRIPEGRFWVLVKVVQRTPPIVPRYEDIKPQVRAMFVQQFAPPPEVIFRQLAQKYSVTVQDLRFKFVEDEIRTQMMLESPAAFQPPAEPPSVTRPPSREGERLEEPILREGQPPSR
jgi:foldase protein PrsA